MNLQICLKSPLVRLRPLIQEDFEALFLVASDEELWKQHPNSDRYKKPVFENLFEQAMQSGGALTIFNTSNQIIGSTRFRLLPAQDAIEIGWTFLARNYWGGKYNHAIKSLMIDYAFKYKEKVILYIDINNIRSQKAALKIGAKRISKEQEPSIFRDDPLYHTYAIVKSEW